MAEETNISWADHTFNGWIGCARVSPACTGCYAAHLMETRMGRVTWGGPGKGVGTRSRTSEENWRKPLSWNRKAAATRTKPFVFCSSLADVFDNQVPTEWRRDLFNLIRSTPNLVWLLLTKRPQNIVKLSTRAGGLPENAAIGTTIEDQERAQHNVPLLLEAKFLLNPAFAFLSCEPLLSEISLRFMHYDSGNQLPAAFRVNDERCSLNALEGTTTWPGCHYISPLIPDKHEISNGELWTRAGHSLSVDWVITGGETDQGAHKARPTHPDWFRSLRDQCAAAGVPFHHKKNGEWVSVSEVAGPGEHFRFPDGATVRRVGKKLSGRTIDHVTHDAFPFVRRMP